MALVKYNNNSISSVTSAASFPAGAMTLIKTLTISDSANATLINGSSDVVLDNTYPIYIIKLINIHPYQGIIERDIFAKDNVLYNSNEIYPEQNLLSSRMSFRGYDLYGIQLVPFEYDFESKNLKVYTSVDVIITEYIDCDTGLPCEQGMEELLDKSKNTDKIYNLLGKEIRKREGLYIENGEIKYRIH